VTTPAFLQYEHYAVLGAGASGRSTSRLLLDRGKRVTLFDDYADPAAGNLQPLRERGAALQFGPPQTTAAALAQVQACVVSPGIPIDHPFIAEARRRGKAVLAEIELGWLLRGGARVAAITGTNGKTTVTMLLQRLLEEGGLDSIAAGNIGLPMTEAVTARAGEALARTIFAVEISSFQLETTDAFAPEVAVILNVTPDHLDRHGSMEAYTRAKARITGRQRADHVLVVNQDDAACLAIAAASRARIRRFSLERPVQDGAWLDGELIMIIEPGQRPRRLIAIDELKMVGLHNVANAMAAACAAQVLGVGREAIAATLAAFRSAPHRMEIVATRDGVTYINDSKATNLDAMVQAVSSFEGGIHLIAGGRDKASPFDTITHHLERRVRRLYLIGEAAADMEQAWGERIECRQCGTLANALSEATAAAADGEIILLSPGCASFDQFQSYADRGRQFVEWVNALPPNPVPRPS